MGQALGFVVGPSLMSPGAVDRGVQEVQQLMCLEVSATGMSLINVYIYKYNILRYFIVIII